MWTCESCGEIHEDNFNACWNCGAMKDEAGDFCNDNDELSSRQLYAIAYELHYEERKPSEAFVFYKQIIDEFPGTNEAKLSEEQVENIYESINKSSGDKTLDAPVVLTTAQTLEGYKIIETLEIVTAECCFGINLFQDFFTSLSDIFGGRSETTQKVLRDARKLCLHELKREAFDIGADAVIAVDLDYSEFSGKGKSMLFLVASGTAVKVERNNSLGLNT